MRSTERRRFGGVAVCAALCWSVAGPGGTAQALDLAFPGAAELVLSAPPSRGLHPIATAPWAAGGVPVIAAEGVVREFVWNVTGPDVSTPTLLAALREQLLAQGFEIGFACDAAACGGFDFRHFLPLGEPPEMHVDLSDFHYVAASAAHDEGREYAALTISRGGSTGFVHLALVLPPTAPPPVVLSSRAPDPEGAEIAADETASEGSEARDLIARLVGQGSAALDDLRFRTGASDLTGDGFASLATLAEFLAGDPSRRVVLVGHTDATGSLAANIALSEARAEAVRAYLTGRLGVDPGQVAAEGIGYLAPRAANSSDEGREANRRVEVVLADPG